MHILTIGHGNRNIDEFIELLKEYRTKYLVDVRSKPYSRYVPDFNQNHLNQLLTEAEIRYVFMGDLLGGRPANPEVYASSGQVSYELVKELPSFKLGIERLEHAASLDEQVTIMCSELRPAMCHRAKLIGEVLQARGIVVQHIEIDGKLRDHENVMKEVLNRDESQLPLFENLEREQFHSRKRYKKSDVSLKDENAPSDFFNEATEEMYD